MTRAPNILIVMVDQLTGTLFPDGPADFLHAPNLKALAARSARFRNNYTASPLCAPGRAAASTAGAAVRVGGRLQCVRCPPGRFAARAGQPWPCASCPAGRFAPLMF